MANWQWVQMGNNLGVRLRRLFRGTKKHSILCICACMAKLGDIPLPSHTILSHPVTKPMLIHLFYSSHISPIAHSFYILHDRYVLSQSMDLFLLLACICYGDHTPIDSTHGMLSIVITIPYLSRSETSTTIPQCLPSAVRRGFALHVCQPKKESSLLGQDDAHRHSGRPLDHSALTDLPATDPRPHPGDVSKSQR